MKILKPRKYLVVGCGGVASYFAYPFAKYLKHSSFDKYATTPKITFMDGDTLEHKNLARQNFQDNGVGASKAEILATDTKTFYSPDRVSHNINYFTPGNSLLDENTLVFCFCDNHLARKHVIEEVTESGGAVIIAANSEFSAQAYIYFQDWEGKTQDPTLRYEEILTDNTGSPLSHAYGCQSDVVLDNSPQTSMANHIAASLAMNLYNFWFVEVPKMGQEDIDSLWKKFPIEFFMGPSGAGRLTTEDAALMLQNKH